MMERVSEGETVTDGAANERIDGGEGRGEEE